jgi:quercetin dioxygenase-like cupin family protein
MITVNLNQLPLTEFTAPGNQGQRCKATFPLLGMHGTKNSATVYFELDPNEQLGTHTDSAEEIILVLEGSVQATVGDEKQTATKGHLVLIPKMLPHNLENIGSKPAKILGFFGGANHIVATFEQVWEPTGSNMVDTSTLG